MADQNLPAIDPNVMEVNPMTTDEILKLQQRKQEDRHASLLAMGQERRELKRGIEPAEEWQAEMQQERDSGRRTIAENLTLNSPAQKLPFDQRWHEDSSAKRSKLELDLSKSLDENLAQGWYGTSLGAYSQTHRSDAGNSLGSEASTKKYPQLQTLFFDGVGNESSVENRKKVDNDVEKSIGENLQRNVGEHLLQSGLASSSSLSSSNQDDVQRRTISLALTQSNRMDSLGLELSRERFAEEKDNSDQQFAQQRIENLLPVISPSIGLSATPNHADDIVRERKTFPVLSHQRNRQRLREPNQLVLAGLDDNGDATPDIFTQQQQMNMMILEELKRSEQRRVEPQRLTQASPRQLLSMAPNPVQMQREKQIALAQQPRRVIAQRLGQQMQQRTLGLTQPTTTGSSSQEQQVQHMNQEQTRRLAAAHKKPLSNKIVQHPTANIPPLSGSLNEVDAGRRLIASRLAMRSQAKAFLEEEYKKDDLSDVPVSQPATEISSNGRVVACQLAQLAQRNHLRLSQKSSTVPNELTVESQASASASNLRGNVERRPVSMGLVQKSPVRKLFDVHQQAMGEIDDGSSMASSGDHGQLYTLTEINIVLTCLSHG
jgi:hypothetical protein